MKKGIGFGSVAILIVVGAVVGLLFTVYLVYRSNLGLGAKASVGMTDRLSKVRYPRLQSRHQIMSFGFASDPKRFLKYSVVGFSDIPLDESQNPLVDFDSELKKYNPSVITRIYSNPIIFRAGDRQDVWPGHYLFYPKTTITKKISPSATTVTVADATYFKAGSYAMFWDFTSLSDVEHIKVLSVSGNNLTVERGAKPTDEKGRVSDYISSVARAHAKGTAISFHVYNKQPYRWIGNISVQCPAGSDSKNCGPEFRNLVDYRANFENKKITASRTNGIKIDSALSYPYGACPFPMDTIDYNNDGKVDGANASKNGDKTDYNSPWSKGLMSYYEALRKQAGPDKLLYGNNSQLNTFLNGKFYQGWSRANLLSTKTWDRTMSDYFQGFKFFASPRFISTDPEVVNEDFSEVRFTLAATLMGNGYYNNKGSTPEYDDGSFLQSTVYAREAVNEGAELGNIEASILCGDDGGPGGPPSRISNIGSDTQYDEYDGGLAGTSIATDIDTTQTIIRVAPGTAGKFTADSFDPGEENILYLPNEIVYLNSVNEANDTLNVTRAFVPDYLKQILEKLGQPTNLTGAKARKGEKIYTLKQLRSSVGWMGEAIQGNRSSCKVSNFVPINCMRYFENAVAIVNPTNATQTFPLDAKYRYRRIKGTQVPSVNNGEIVVNSITLKARDGIILVKSAL